MCTLTLVPWQSDVTRARGVRVVCNRDESRLRPTAVPPQIRQAAKHQILMPVDPVSDGTWIGVSDAPLIAVLMNVYLAQLEKDDAYLEKPTPAASRGVIVPRILACDHLADAARLAEALQPGDYEPFRLLVIDPTSYFEVVWSAGQYSVSKPREITAPLFFTSSGLGDDLVATPRQQLFNTLFFDSDWTAAQDLFHRHEWPDRRFASVWMTRPEARTQSITWIEMDASGVAMRYATRSANDDENELEISPFQLQPRVAIAQEHPSD